MRKILPVHNQRRRVINPCTVNKRWDVRSESKAVDESSCWMRFDAVASKLADVGENVARELPERVRHGKYLAMCRMSLIAMRTVLCS